MVTAVPGVGPQPGMLATTRRAGAAGPNLLRILSESGMPDPTVREFGSVHVAWWGLPTTLSHNTPLSLTTAIRSRRGDVASTDVYDLLQHPDSGRLATVLPPFGAAGLVDGKLIIAADTMGYRQLYHAQGEDWAGASTSAQLLARALGGGLDDEAIAVQALLGWQLGQRTLFAGVHKLTPGSVAALSDGSLTLSSTNGDVPSSSVTLEEAVSVAAPLLREFVGAYLTDRPDAVLQLTGGQDSRLLLSAVPKAARRGLRIMTLGDWDSPDVAVAGSLADRYGLQHEVHGLAGLERLPENEAWDRCVAAAGRLDCMADPLAFASLAWAEGQFEQGSRLSGLGGEVARGFYYYGPNRTLPVTRERAKRLAAWRMFANEAVESAALTPAFEEWARTFAYEDVYRHLAASADDWFRATDWLYLRHRMQRWAGLTDTAVCFDREVINPMLDHEFLDLAMRLSPTDKRNSRFLARLQMELDPELGRIPLEGRPAPAVYVKASALNYLRATATTVGKLARKVRQRLTRSHRPPVGGPVLSRKVVELWRQQPALVEPVRGGRIIEDSWLDGVLDGGVDPDPSSVSFVVNLCVASAP